MPIFNLVAVLSGLAAAASCGVSDFLAAVASLKLNPLLVTVFVMLVTALSFSFTYAFFLDHQHPWATEGILFAAAAGLLMVLAVSSFYRGLSVGTVSIVSPIGAAYPLVTTLIVMVVFRATLQAYQLFGIVLTVTGIMVTAGLLNTRRRDFKIDAGVLLALISCLSWGTMFALLGQAVMLLGWEKGTLVDTWFMVVGSVVLLPFIGRKQLTRSNIARVASSKVVVAGAVLQTTGVVALNFGFTHTTATAIETTISACYPILTVLLAVVFFKEKVNWLVKTGIAATILGVATISYH